MNELKIEDKIKVLTKAYNIISQYFAHDEAAVLDFDTDFNKILTDVDQVDRLEFYFRMVEFIAKLNNRHSGYYDKNLIELKPMLPIWSDYIEEKWIVIRSY